MNLKTLAAAVFTALKSYLSLLIAITVGYLLVLGGLIFFAAEINTNVQALTVSSKDLYQHPFQVNRAAHEAREAAFGIRTELLQALALRDVKNSHSNLDESIEAYSKTLETNLSIIEANFLGDMTRVHEAKELLKLWAQQRGPLIRLLQEHKDVEAEKILTGQTSPTYKKVAEILDYVIEFSGNKAAFLANQANAQSNAITTRIKKFQIGVVLLTVLVGGLTIVAVVKQLRERDLELARNQEHINHMAHHDTLTGLPNRALFQDRLEQALVLARRNKDAVTLFYMDLDGFKKVNDTLGHPAGDLVLIEVARRLTHCLRESDSAARLGGDEFAIVLKECHQPDDVIAVAKKIIDSIAPPFDLAGQVAHIGISIGIAHYPANGANEAALMSAADAAMYAAKQAGKNTYRIA